ncbi:MAG: hypothetical protein HYX38_15500 [Rhodospirillales bacterium]|nr:hypothetical protein [Rhodospirillales bacterium]
MRKAIDTAPKNGEFVILEDAARGTIAVARWSAEAAQWLDDGGAPSQLNATHWHAPLNRDEEGTPGQLNARFWQTLRPAKGVVKTGDEPGSLSGPSERRIHRTPSSPAPGAQPQRAATPKRYANAWARVADFAGRGGGKVLSPFAVAGGWIGHRRRSIVAMAACLLVGAALGDLGKSLLYGTASEDNTELKRALQQERERASKLAGDVAAAEAQAELSRQAGEASAREKEAGERALVELRHALQSELAKTNKLAGQLAEAQRDNAAQTAVASKIIAEARRAEEELHQALKRQEAEAAQPKVRPAEQLALKQERDKAEKIRVELAAAQREMESQAAMLRSAGDEAARLKEASARATDELRQALRQAQDKAEKLAGEVTAAREQAEAQTAAVRASSDEARRVVETNKRTADQQGQALREAQARTDKLGSELAAVRQEMEAQRALARVTGEEAQRAAETSKRRADEQDQALREAQAKAEKLVAELAAARREVQSQVSVASAARDRAADVTEAAERSADEQRRALQQERDKTGNLATELAEARSSLEAQAKAKAAEEVARDNELAAMREELQKAKAEATSARDFLPADRPRTVPASASLIKDVTGQTRQPTNAVTQPAAAIEQGSQQVVRLIARANLLLEQGNIGAARNLLDQAAEMGSTEALFWLAETYDPQRLSARQTFGTQSDVAKARELYGRALAGGLDEAKARLEALQQ